MDPDTKFQAISIAIVGILGYILYLQSLAM
jgi:preprotein translocase subunit Sss1